MRLGRANKRIVLGNVELIKYCKSAGISVEKLKQCEIEQMGNLFVFVLEKENKPKSKCLIPLDVDLDTQPDVVLTMEVDENNSLEFETFEKTRRILNV